MASAPSWDLGLELVVQSRETDQMSVSLSRPGALTQSLSNIFLAWVESRRWHGHTCQRWTGDVGPPALARSPGRGSPCHTRHVLSRAWVEPGGAQFVPGLHVWMPAVAWETGPWTLGISHPAEIASQVPGRTRRPGRPTEPAHTGSQCSWLGVAWGAPTEGKQASRLPALTRSMHKPNTRPQGLPGAPRRKRLTHPAFPWVP